MNTSTETKQVNNTWVWILAFAPIIGRLLEYAVAIVFSDSEREFLISMTENHYWYITVILNIFISYTDEKKIKNSGIDTDKFGKLFFIVPVYLWKRAESLSPNKNYFWAWIASFVISFFL